MSRSPRSPGSAKLVGSETPRLATEPLRKLTRSTSRGYEVADFAEQVLGEPLLPWQRWLAIHALELTPAGDYRFRTVLTLVARQSGKTHLLKVLALWRMYVDGARKVVGAAQNMRIAREAWIGAMEMAESVPDLRREFASKATGSIHPHFSAAGAEYTIVAASRGAGRGLSVDLLILDEIREQHDWSAWSSLSKTTMARASGQIWAISNAGDDNSVVLNQLRETALVGHDPSIGLFEWSAPEGCDLDDPKAWVAANPGLGHTVSEQAIRSSLGTDPPVVFRTEVLCQRVPSLDGAVDGFAWASCADAAGNLDDLRERVVACVEVAEDGQHVTYGVAALAEDGRVRVELVEAWDSTEAARGSLAAVNAIVQPTLGGWFSGGPAAALGNELRALGFVELKGAEVTEVCMSFADLVKARAIVHAGQGLLDAHVFGAQRYHQGDGWRFVRKGAGHVDALYAVAGATHLARKAAAGEVDIASQVF